MKSRGGRQEAEGPNHNRPAVIGPHDSRRDHEHSRRTLRPAARNSHTRGRLSRSIVIPLSSSVSQPAARDREQLLWLATSQTRLP